jgi:hypothetical protein
MTYSAPFSGRTRRLPALALDYDHGRRLASGPAAATSPYIAPPGSWLYIQNTGGQAAHLRLDGGGDAAADAPQAIAIPPRGERHARLTAPDGRVSHLADAGATTVLHVIPVREILLPVSARNAVVPAESRAAAVPAETRTGTVPVEDRTAVVDIG